MGPGGSLLKPDSKKEGAEECIDPMGQKSVVQLVLNDRRHLDAATR